MRARLQDRSLLWMRAGAWREFNGGFVVVLGIDIGGRQIRSGMVDDGGAIVASRAIPTPPDLDAFLPAMQDAVRWLLGTSGVPAGVGVGCKGVIDPDSTRIESLRGSLHYLQGL